MRQLWALIQQLFEDGPASIHTTDVAAAKRQAEDEYLLLQEICQRLQEQCRQLNQRLEVLEDLDLRVENLEALVALWARERNQDRAGASIHELIEQSQGEA